VAATENGQTYYERCWRSWPTSRRPTRGHAGAGRAGGILRVNAPMSFGHAASRPRHRDLMEQYPELRVALVLSDEFVDPVQEGFDVTLRIGDLPSSSLIARKIAPARRVVCARAGLSSPARTRASHELRDHACLTYATSPPRAVELTAPTAITGSTCRDAVRRQCRGLARCRVQGRGIAPVAHLHRRRDLQNGACAPS